jgi:hypothetical protein
MFRALLAHTQEVLHKRHLVYCVLFHFAGTKVGVEGSSTPTWVAAN